MQGGARGRECAGRMPARPKSPGFCRAPRRTARRGGRTASAPARPHAGGTRRHPPKGMHGFAPAVRARMPPRSHLECDIWRRPHRRRRGLECRLARVSQCARTREFIWCRLTSARVNVGLAGLGRLGLPSAPAIESKGRAAAGCGIDQRPKGRGVRRGAAHTVPGCRCSRALEECRAAKPGDRPRCSRVRRNRVRGGAAATHAKGRCGAGPHAGCAGAQTGLKGMRGGGERQPRRGVDK